MKRLSAVLISSLMSPHISAAPLFQYDAEQQFLNQQQRQKAQEEQLTPVVPDVRLSPDLPPASATTDFPAEKPCFTISQVVLSGADALPHWLPLQR